MNVSITQRCPPFCPWCLAILRGCALRLRGPAPLTRLGERQALSRLALVLMDGLTFVLVAFLDDLTLLRFSSSSSGNLFVAYGWREDAVARALLAQLSLLADHTGAATTADWRRDDFVAGTEWLMQTVLPDWDLSD